MRVTIKLDTEATKQEIIAALSEIEFNSLKVKVAGEPVAAEEPTTKKAIRKKKSSKSSSSGGLVLHDNGRINISQTLKSIGRSRAEIMNSNWPRGSAELKVRLAIARKKIIADMKR